MNIRISPLIAACVVGVLSSILPLHAAPEPRLVKDIFATAGSSSPQFLTAVGGTLFFTATDATSGTELWKSDGTEAGTVRVKDIKVGASGSDPANLTAVGGSIFFSVRGPLSAPELWRSDGTDAGTVAVVKPNSRDVRPYELTSVGETLFFIHRGQTRPELWKSDGTDAGTISLRGIYPQPLPADISYLTAMDGTLFFSAVETSSGSHLWKSDGTAAGTVGVSGGFGFYPSYLTAVGGTLFFKGDAIGSGDELWKSDGPEAGTVQVKDILPGGASSRPTSLTAVSGMLYFIAEDGNGRELWKSDGTAAGTVRVKDIVPGSGSSDPTGLTAVSGKVFFVATDETGNTALWKSDGTEAGTMRVKDVLPTGGTLTAVGESLYFIADDGIHGSELWKSDGTEAGTAMVADLMAGPEGSSPMNLKMAGSRLFFSAATESVGRELYALDLSPPDIQIEASEVAFGGTAVNQSADLPVVLRNVGKEADLSGIVATISGPDANQFSIFTAPAGSVGGGQQTSVTVRFTPTSVGPKTATLSIASNDSDEGLVTLTVMGTGITPYQAWVQSEGVTGGAGGHDDADGLSNVLEFAFGTDPRRAQSSVAGGSGGTVVRGAPTLGLASPSTVNYQGVFARRIDRALSGLSYAPQFSHDLTTWHDGIVMPTVLADDGVIQIVSVPFPQLPDGKAAKFFRVRVAMP